MNIKKNLNNIILISIQHTAYRSTTTFTVIIIWNPGYQSNVSGKFWASVDRQGFTVAWWPLDTCQLFHFHKLFSGYD